MTDLALQEEPGGPLDVSVVISTYDRYHMLPETLNSMLAQRFAAERYEVLVVDNNSTDLTREVVQRYVERAPGLIRYLFEVRQGLSHGRNTGIAHARGKIIAFTDDDIRPAPDWLQRIKEAFDRNPEVDVVGGRVLPRWDLHPPAWLTRDHWAPLALVDFGEQALHVNRERPLCLVGANSAYRRSALDRIGNFSLDVQRVRNGIGSIDEGELLERLWRSGGKGLYDPEIVVYAQVQAERLSRAYHRRWHAGHGRSYAILRQEEFERSRARILNIPVHLYRAALLNAGHWVASRLAGRSDAAFQSELKLCFFAGYVRQRWFGRAGADP